MNCCEYGPWYPGKTIVFAIGKTLQYIFCLEFKSKLLLMVGSLACIHKMTYEPETGETLHLSDKNFFEAKVARI